MKHLELFENFITNIFRNKKYDKLIKLGNFFADFINKNILTCNAESRNYNTSIDIFIDTRFLRDINIIRLYYYNDDTISGYFYPFPSNYDKELENLKDFFYFTFNTTKRFFDIKIDEINDIMNKITKENFDAFLDMKKYNL